MFTCSGQGLLLVLRPKVNSVAFKAMVRQDRGFDPNLVDLISCRFFRNDRDEFSVSFGRGIMGLYTYTYISLLFVV